MQKLIVVETIPQLKTLVEYLADKDIVAVDTETTGLKKGSQVIGISVCAEDEVGYYVILRSWNVKQQKLIDRATLQEVKSLILALKSKRLLMANAPFDCSMIKDNFGIELMPYVFHDVIIGGHLLNENRKNGLKERGAELFGEDALTEKIAMIESIKANGGEVTKANYELYKADPYLIAEYGAKDAILTHKVFVNDLVELDKQKLDSFFYDDESMPLLRGPTYDMNTAGLKVDVNKLEALKKELETECLEAKAFIHREIEPEINHKYPGTSKAKTFNLNSNEQLAWLLFDHLENSFNTLTDAGKGVCKHMEMPLPYTAGAKRDFIAACLTHKGEVWRKAGTYNPKTKKRSKKDAKIESPYKYMSTGKVTLTKFATDYKWVEKLLEYKKAEKILNTYVIGIQNRMEYGIIRPEFKQFGTTSGRYSSKNPNFQNLPKNDKRVKACIIARPGKVFVGADYSQLEPRVFASLSGDERLQACFAKGDDFYSVVGMPIFDTNDKCSLKKGDKNFWRDVHKKEGEQSKILALAVPYGRVARQLAIEMGVEVERAQEIIDDYFDSWPKVKQMQLNAHNEAKKNGVVYTLYGRPRRIPKAMDITKIYGNTRHAELPYEARTLLNLAMNHRVQGTAASIMNRSAIAFWNMVEELALDDSEWKQVKIVMQVHDELIIECPEHLGESVSALLKSAMEDTVVLPGVALIAEPKIAYNIADLK